MSKFTNKYTSETAKDFVKKFNCILNDEYKGMNEKQYSFDGCIDKTKLRFDFAVFNNSKLYLIEFDGIQHFEPFDYYGGMKKYNDICRKDNIKNEYCKNNNIPLLRLRYDDENIENKIIKFLIA